MIAVHDTVELIDEQDALVKPWEYLPYSLISWWDMEKFSASSFYLIGKLFESIRQPSLQASSEAILGNLASLVSFLSQVKEHCEKIGLLFSIKQIDRLLAELTENENVNIQRIGIAIDELSTRIRDEMSVNLFMFIRPKQSEFYNQPELFEKEVNCRFPNIQYDLVEVGNCYACGRSTATVFHLMRIMEVGVQELGNKLGITLVNKKNWQNILDEINKKIKSLDPKDLKTAILSQASANLYSVKLAWRNEVMHPKETYTSEEADNLIRQVRIFMQHLASVI